MLVASWTLLIFHVVTALWSSLSLSLSLSLIAALWWLEAFGFSRKGSTAASMYHASSIAAALSPSVLLSSRFTDACKSSRPFCRVRTTCAIPALGE
ncbi:hypothetical protein L7F22_021029, partial [Adiantum nelumboides]|nr:hypothetical protein [Adiantum nelumboides]